MNLFVKKSMTQLMHEAKDEGQHTLKRTLTANHLILLGIGAIIGAGLFVRTAAAAGGHAGAAVTISFIIAALGCAFAGLLRRVRVDDSCVRQCLHLFLCNDG